MDGSNPMSSGMTFTAMYGNQLPIFITIQSICLCVFSVEVPRKAAECVATFLMFKPQDETMLNNKQFYLSAGVKETFFKPREVNISKILKLKNGQFYTILSEAIAIW